MNVDGALGLGLVLTSVLLLVVLSGQLGLRVRTRNLLLVGLALRMVGALVYLFVMSSAYGGGDHVHYFEKGLAFAEATGGTNAPALWDPALWTTGTWWGTSFIVRLTGVVLSGIGPTMAGAFFVFAIAGYFGLLAIALAFHRSFPEVPVDRYLVWVVLFPSLWFWPTALGKEAVILFGIGLATLGFVGRGGHARWLLTLAGIAVVFVIRPQVAATLTFAIAAGQVLSSGSVSALRRVLQGFGVVAVGAFVIALSGDALGIELFSTDEVEGYLGTTASRSSIGGSSFAVEAAGVSPLQGLVNTLFRPFLWEARGGAALIAALEVLVVWTVIWLRRRSVAAFVRDYRRTRLFWMAVVFFVAYATALGMAVGNTGIIARQRIHIFPFLFFMFAVLPDMPRRRSQGHAQRGAPGGLGHASV